MKFAPVLAGWVFAPKREKQRHCSGGCRVVDAVKRHKRLHGYLRSDYRPTLAEAA
jgi:hypothetical protein